MNDLLVIVPTFKRAAMVKTLCDIWLAFDTQADIVFGVDNDDQTPLKIPDDPRFGTVIAEPMRFSAWTNYLWEHEKGKGYKYFGSMTDKHHPRTRGWENEVVDVLSQWHDFGFCYPDDGAFHEDIPTATFMSASVPETLGWMTCPQMQHFCVDNIWKHLGLATGRIQYLPLVKIEMMHSGVKKSDYDFTQYRSDKNRETDLIAYKRYLTRDFFNDVAKLQTLKGTVLV